MQLEPVQRVSEEQWMWVRVSSICRVISPQAGHCTTRTGQHRNTQWNDDILTSLHMPTHTGKRLVGVLNQRVLGRFTMPTLRIGSSGCGRRAVSTSYRVHW